MRSTFSTIFYLKRQVVKKDGTVPIMGRITVDGTQTQFSCKLTIDPKIWETKTGRATGRSTVALETNRMLDKIRVKINTHYQEIMDRDNFVTAEKVKNAFLGLEHRCHTLMKVYEQFTADYAKMVEAGMKSKKSYEKMLMDGKLKNAKQELYWDMFLFCIFTGLSFSDMRNLKEENIVTYFDDHQWIKINRQKTSDYYIAIQRSTD